MRLNLVIWLLSRPLLTCRPKHYEHAHVINVNNTDYFGKIAHANVWDILDGKIFGTHRQCVNVKDISRNNEQDYIDSGQTVVVK